MKNIMEKHLRMKYGPCYDVSFDWFNKDAFERNWKNPGLGPLLAHEEICTICKPVNVIESTLRRIYPGIRNIKITVHKPKLNGEF